MVESLQLAFFSVLIVEWNPRMMWSWMNTTFKNIKSVLRCKKLSANWSDLWIYPKKIVWTLQISKGSCYNSFTSSPSTSKYTGRLLSPWPASGTLGRGPSPQLTTTNDLKHGLEIATLVHTLLCELAVVLGGQKDQNGKYLSNSKIIFLLMTKILFYHNLHLCTKISCFGCIWARLKILNCTFMSWVMRKLMSKSGPDIG